MRRLACVGAVDVEALGLSLASLVAVLTFAGLDSRDSSRFLRVTERRAPLKTCAWSLVTAFVAAAGVLKSASASKEVMHGQTKDMHDG